MEYQQETSRHNDSQSSLTEAPNETDIQMSCLQQPEASSYGTSQLPVELVLVKNEPVLPIQASLQQESLYDNWSMVPNESTSLQLPLVADNKGELLFFSMRT